MEANLLESTNLSISSQISDHNCEVQKLEGQIVELTEHIKRVNEKNHDIIANKNRLQKLHDIEIKKHK